MASLTYLSGIVLLLVPTNLMVDNRIKKYLILAFLILRIFSHKIRSAENSGFSLQESRSLLEIRKKIVLRLNENKSAYLRNFVPT